MKSYYLKMNNYMKVSSRLSFIIYPFLCILGIASPLRAQDVETIKADVTYLWGEGFGSTDAAAKQAALADLTAKISVSVSSEFNIDEQEINTSDGADSKSIIENVVRTYSSGTLTNTETVILKHEPEAQAFAYIKKSEIEKIFKGREDRIFSYMRSAENAEKDGRIDDALRNYYWGFTLLKSLQHPNECRYKSKQEGTEEVLVNWIPEKMNAILGNLRTDIAGVEGEIIQLLINYKGQPVTSVDFRFMDGQNFSNICSAKDGIAEIELRPGASPDRLQVKYEFEYLGQSRQDKELEQVMKLFHGTPFAKATTTVNLGKKKEMKVAQQQFQAAAAAVGTATHAVKVAQPDEFNTAVLAIIDAVKKKQYNSVKHFFTDEGFGMFDALVHYGDARILGTPTLNFYELQGRTICRSVPMSFSFKNNKRKFTEDVTFTFNAEKKIESVAFGLSKNARDAVFEKQAPWSDDVRMSIVTFLENYKTAFALKRLDYIRSIFDDNAIIIVGHVTKAAPKSGENARYSNNEIVKFNRLDKNTYLDNLARSFKSNEFINIRFSDSEISRMGVGGDTYGIQIHQDYYSSNYGDTGYLFVLVDLNDVFQPCIKVRTWQPERDPNLNANGGWDNPHYGLYWGGNF